jgi:hypothetical protein
VKSSERLRRKQRRLRGLLRLTVLLVIVSVLVWTGVRVAHATSNPAQVNNKAYVVHSGDNLWTIAARQYGAGRDLRPVIYAIERYNKLQTTSLVPGQILRLPALE